MWRSQISKAPTRLHLRLLPLQPTVEKEKVKAERKEREKGDEDLRWCVTLDILARILTLEDVPELPWVWAIASVVVEPDIKPLSVHDLPSIQVHLLNRPKTRRNHMWKAWP